MVEDAAEHTQQRRLSPAAVAPQIDDERLVLARLAHRVVHLCITQVELGQLPDEQVVAHFDLAAACAAFGLSVFRFPVKVVDVLTACARLTRQVHDPLKLCNFRYHVILLLLAVRFRHNQTHAGSGSERVVGVEYLPVVVAPRLEAINRENLVACL